jgi:2,4-dienoyl-CoA reductase-like NADH-dependent reductase (Old Yellow Enzyme family)/thioredoxin reductase
MAYEKLGAKGHIGNLETKNRLVMTAMGVGVGDHSGIASDAFIEFYRQRAQGGAGLIVTEVTRVNDVHGVCEYDQLSLSSDDMIPSFKKLADAVHAYDTKIFAQLHHPGRESHLSINPQTKELVSASAIASRVAPEPTRALEVDEIHSLVQDFADAAVRAQKAGLDGVELHAGHGYLIMQFLSANDNFRTDEYGGSLENRMRFLMEIIAAIREACGKDFPISVRLSSSEFLDGIGIMKGITLDESIEIAKACEKAGVDFLDVSSGTHFTGNTIVEPTSYQEGWKVDLAAEIKRHVNIPVAATSVFRNPDYCEKTLEEGKVDFIAMGRSWLADPEWGTKALEGRADEINKCTGCMYCFETAGNAIETGETHSYCAVNPYMGQETLYGTPKKDGAGRKVVVVGGGPAGIEAAIVLAQREFNVTLLEKEDVLGGQMYLASNAPKRDKMANFKKYGEVMLKKLGVDVRYNTEATPELVKSFDPYAVFICSGSQPVMPRSIPGIDGENVYTVPQILGGKVHLTGKNIVVAGAGLSGLETAEYLQEEGNDVTCIDMTPSVGFGAFQLSLMDEEGQIARTGVRTMPGHKLVEIRNDSVLIEDTAGYQIEVPADAIVMSLGVRPTNSLKDGLEGMDNVFLIGDAAKAGQRVPQAVHGAFEAAYNL